MNQKFLKALMLLDHGSLDRGEATLREVITQAEQENDKVSLIQGLVCLGDVLFTLDRAPEGLPFLERALSEGQDDDLDDVCDSELARAKELIGSTS